MNAPLADATRPAPAARPPQVVQVVQALRAALPAHALIWQPEDTIPYECDGLTAYRQRPLAVALPETEEQVAAVLRTCHRLGGPGVARRARPSGRRDAACAGPDAVAGQVQPHPRDRSGQPHRDGTVRRAQSRDQR